MDNIDQFATMDRLGGESWLAPREPESTCGDSRTGAHGKHRVADKLVVSFLKVHRLCRLDHHRDLHVKIPIALFSSMKNKRKGGRRLG